MGVRWWQVVVVAVVAAVVAEAARHLHAEGHLPLDVGAPRRRRRPRHRLEEAPRDALEAARDAVAVLVAAARRREVEQLEEEVDLRGGAEEVVVRWEVVEAVRQVVVVVVVVMVVVVVVMVMVVVVADMGSQRTFVKEVHDLLGTSFPSHELCIDLPRSECGRVITGRMNGRDSGGVEFGRAPT